MSETIEKILTFNDIKAKDPKIKLEGGLIIIKPFYFYYSFLMNFICIIILLYFIVFKDIDLIYETFSLLFIGFFIYFILSSLKFFNTIEIDPKNKIVTISPVPIFKKKKEILYFKEIQDVFVKSNEYAGGFWLAHRRYYIVVKTKTSGEMILISSNEKGTATQISEKISALLD